MAGMLRLLSFITNLTFAMVLLFWGPALVRAPLAPAEIIPVAEAGSPVRGAAAPRRLTIPRLQKSAQIIDVGTQPDGKMDVPPDGQVLGWYQKGPQPGRNGTALLAGHVRTAAGPGFFSSLEKLRVGDVLYVTDELGMQRAFRVKKAVTYDVKTAPIAEIMGQKPGKNLHLITCAGTWDTTLGHYDKRLVVYAEAVDSARAIVVANK